jgi:hypothetical protein
MKLRKFIDARGVQWTVWSPDPSTGPAVPGPTDCPAGGLCFESPLERRRLTHAPADWETLSASELSLLCEQAQSIPLRRDDESTGDFTRRQDEMFEEGLTPRTFTTPDNRVWLVSECQVEGEPTASGESSRTVLRFTSGTTVRQLENFPADWARYRPGKLIELALSAHPVRVTARPEREEPSREEPRDNA